jgi:hypothetical protein
MYTDIVSGAAFRAAPGLTTPVSCLSATTPHISLLQRPSSGVYAAARKLLHC